MVKRNDNKVAVRARIQGRVQGVGYRAWVKGEAARLGLYGWVRNRTDGSVEALFVGAGADVVRMLDLCSSGPAGAIVDAISQEKAQGITAGRFDVKPTV
ncbi:acylphosphatase [Kordiimonas sp.]|uniref:acylphosphatase n=1 Tax=Kordiimonas sp. TaxID=1970157 RepID=UPI003A92A8FD